MSLPHTADRAPASTALFRTDGILHVTLIAPDLAAACAAYRDQLGLSVAARESLDSGTATVLGLVELAGTAVAWLANPAGERILRLIEDPQATVLAPMFRHGWLSLEVLVADVDTLAGGLRAPFQVLRPPADLELSPAIRASQVLGPCGEMLYLTSIKAPVPPFDLPISDERVSHTFIGVMSTPDRTASQAAWAALAGHPGWAFDTRITVLNDAFGRELTDRYPVAVVELPGQCMVEIDQVALPQARVQEGLADSHQADVLAQVRTRHAGQHSLALHLPALPVGLAPAGWHQITDARSGDQRHLGLIGPAGEHVQLVLPG